MTQAPPLTVVTVTVTANPAVDVTYTVDGVRLGESHRVPTPLYRAGGKGVNVARVAHQLGFPALAEAEWRALTAAVVEALHGEGPDAPARTGVLVGSGSLPDGAPADFYPALVALAHQADVPAIIDASGPAILAAARAGADLLKPNHHELIQATGETDLVAAARQLIALGAQMVLVSAGAEGMMAFDVHAPGMYWRAVLPTPLHGNPTGAGDAAVAAAAVALAGGITDSISLAGHKARGWIARGWTASGPARACSLVASPGICTCHRVAR